MMKCDKLKFRNGTNSYTVKENALFETRCTYATPSNICLYFIETVLCPLEPSLWYISMIPNNGEPSDP